ncbi:hypothetical protein M406DRAFT_75534 [Cryphonectria parasitica EP155]|uniref:Uncharacterized protein n=1 Tax=Cryphonectria parasitica (strain ATCC 38755 / EP155) TaxID=660469 RepID=A0A9P5CRF7_CRYP1|nr:uncharacterized protein M406DRAFT_75534 [Cryphonectria parasitica EP155]KAF3768198.1 hypothetical protein M406DRAFT_75534 [Cryphonectria parasitica EP155]
MDNLQISNKITSSFCTTMSEIQQQWRTNFQKRLLLAFSKLQQDQPLNTTAAQHCRAFRKHLERNQAFAQEIAKLNQLEMEILAISSIKTQLQEDSSYFSADEVFRIFTFSIRTERRAEVCSWLNGQQSSDYVKTLYWNTTALLFGNCSNNKLFYLTEATSMIPLLATVVSYLHELRLEDWLQLALARACLSASYFGLMPWKEYMLQTAEIFGSTDSSLLQSLRLRSFMLRRLKAEDVSLGSINDPDRRFISRYENGIHGERIVLEMKVLLNNDASIEESQACQARFQPFPWSELSLQERRVLMKGQAVIAKAYRNKGQFQRASDQYQNLINEHISAKADMIVGRDFLANQAETLCELRNTSKAITMLESEVNFHKGDIGTRLHLGLANAWLMKSLFDFQASGRVSAASLLEAQNRYAAYLKTWESRQAAGLTKTNKSNHYLALAGLAMAFHVATFSLRREFSLRGRWDWSFSDMAKLVEAMQAWRKARVAAMECWPSKGFAAMIALYSESEIAFRLDLGTAKQLRKEARMIFAETGRQYHFIGQGTVWLDIVSSQSLPEERLE